MKYTKGKWQAGNGFGVTTNEGLMYIADCYPFCEGLARPRLIEAEANAHLISASPDLYKACELGLSLCESFIHSEYDGVSYIDKLLAELEPIRKALAKAGG